MNRPFLIIQLRPEDSTADNEFAKICHYGGLNPQQVARIRAEQCGLPEIELENYAGIIVGGSPFDVSTPQQEKSPLQRQLESEFDRLLIRVVSRDFPFLGCCSGNGLLGACLGATISRRHAEPVGRVEVSLTEAGRKDLLLQNFPDSIAVLTGHKEACDELPSGCELLLTNAACPVQMFRIGENVYATQFHPEGDAEGFSLRINVYKNHGYFPVDQAQALIERVTGVATPEAHEILARFVARYRGDQS